MHFLALDFDGVICDSAGETGTSGWLAARRLWPTRFAAAWPPPALLARFRACRPVVETGFESVLVVRLLADGVRPATIRADFPALAAAARRRWRVSRARLIAVFGQVRDEWRARDPAGWLAAHRFYPGVVAALAAADERLVYIITTKEQRFAVALLAAAGLRLPADRVFGREGGPKAAVLELLGKRHPGAVGHLVEDRLATLLALGTIPGLELRRYLACWGYNTAAQRRQAAATPGLACLVLAQFPRLVAGP